MILSWAGMSIGRTYRYLAGGMRDIVADSTAVSVSREGKKMNLSAHGIYLSHREKKKPTLRFSHKNFQFTVQNIEYFHLDLVE